MWHLKMGLVVLAAGVVAVLSSPPTEIVAQACEVCDHGVGQCSEWLRWNVCLRGDNPDGTPFCANFTAECGVQTSAVDTDAFGAPLVNISKATYASSIEDVVRSCDGVIIYHAPEVDGAEVRAMTNRLVI